MVKVRVRVSLQEMNVRVCVRDMHLVSLSCKTKFDVKSLEKVKCARLISSVFLWVGQVLTRICFSSCFSSCFSLCEL